MNDLFAAIVDLLMVICRRTGLSYPALNIVIYCGLVPVSWAFILWLRQRKFWWFWVIHSCILFFYLSVEQSLSVLSRQFYDANIAALEWGANVSGLGYIGLSLLAGVFLPLLIYGMLLIPPKRWSRDIYFALIFGNLVYYGLVLFCF